jgi:arsenate reductase
MTITASPIRVIFLDRDNCARSQMAEAFLARLGAGRYEACSGGIAVTPIHPLTVAVMGEVGYDLAGQESKSAQRFFGRGGAFQFAIMVALPGESGCPRLFPGALAIVRWAIDDPLLGDQERSPMVERFRRARDRILAEATRWLHEQEQQAEAKPATARYLAAAH